MRTLENGCLIFNKPIKMWDEALAIGNGIMGGLVWGDGEPLKISLDRGDLWDCRPAPQTLEDNFTFKQLVEWVHEGNRPAYIKPFMDCWIHPTPTKIPAGRLELDFGGKAEKVKSTLDIFAAEASVELAVNGRESALRSYLHAENKLGFVRVLGATPKFNVINHDFTPPKDGEEVGDESRRRLGYPEGECFVRDGVSVALQKTATEFTFALLTATKSVPGGMEAVYYVACSTECEDWLDRGIARVKDALREGYEANIKTHKEWWKKYWSRSSINLPDKQLETGWYLANYMLACCSREGYPPMPLQGVWSADEDTLPPWKGEYAANVNTQFCYKHYLAANHWDEGKVMIDHLWNMRDAAKRHARDFYDADGYFMPTSSSLDGQTVGGYPQCYNLGNQIWQALMFYDYYLYSGDEKFLEERAYPYLKGTAAVMERWFEPYGDGKLIFPISVSPEYNESKHEAWLSPMSTYEISLCRSLYLALEEMSLKVCPEDTQHWKDIYGKLLDIPSGGRDGIRVSENTSLGFSHRHHSHLVGLYPFNLLQYHRSEEEKTLMEESISWLEEMGTGVWNGFSFTWFASLYARIENGEAAAYQLKTFYDYICSPNGFHLNGDYKGVGITILHYRPFTLEANLQAADAVQEMLLQSHEEDIRLFSAIPESWADERITFNNLRAQGGLTISAEWDRGAKSVEIKADRTREVSMINPFGGNVCVKRDGGDEIIVADACAKIKFTLADGEKVKLVPVK